MLDSSVFFNVFMTVGFYVLCVFIQKKLKWGWFNPLIMSIVFTVLAVLGTKTRYETYEASTKIITFFLTPATICLAVPLYEKLSELKKNALAILVGIFSGVITSALCVTLVCFIFKLDTVALATFLPKSVTTAIGVGLAEEMGGLGALTAICIIITGVIGNALAEGVCKLFKITHPVAIGTAIGTSAHAGGTSKAVEMGKTEGAISGLSIAVAGLMTVVVAPIVMNFFSGC